MKNNRLAFCGALAGGALGYFAFFWIAEQGYYALALPGALLGIGAGIVKNNSLLVAGACGVLALGLGVFTEYRYSPFVADDGFPYFVSHVFYLRPITLVMIVAGGLIGFWVPFRRHEKDSPLPVAGGQGKL